jgi:hypothetical protein
MKMANRMEFGKSLLMQIKRSLITASEISSMLMVQVTMGARSKETLMNPIVECSYIPYFGENRKIRIYE